MKMPSKDPNLIAAILEYLRSLDFSAVSVSIYAAIAVYLRIAFDQKEMRWQRIVLEIALAMLLAKGAEQIALAVFGLDHLDVAIGTAVGMIGSMQIRQWARKLIAKKLDKSGE
jgi:lambda family phage holin